MTDITPAPAHPRAKIDEQYANIDPQARADIDAYMRTRHRMSTEEREAAFVALATKWFGKADEETLAFREQCKSLGFTVLSRPDGVPDNETYFEILRRRRDDWVARGYMDPDDVVMIYDERPIIPGELQRLREEPSS
jgi:hypothetical protein